MTSPEFEEWREAPDSDGWYEVSSLGRVRSWWGIVPGGGRGQRGRRDEPRLMRASRNQDGYRRFSMHLGVGLKPVEMLVHRAVCEAWHGPAPFEGAVVRHLDGDQLNNLPENLAWGAVQDNHDDMVRHGTRRVGQRNHLAKLDPERVRMMREMYASGRYTLVEMGEMFRVSNVSAAAAIRGRTWAHVK